MIMPPDMEQLPDNSPQEARIFQADQHHSELSGQMDALIHQTEKNDPQPALEAIMGQIEDIKQPIKDAGASIMKMASFLSEMKGEKGDTGDIGPMGPKGEKGEDSNVPGPKGEDGKTPIKGQDYFDGENGKDAEVDYDILVENAIRSLFK